MKNILLFQRIIPYYRVSFFKKLFEKANVIVCYSKEKKNSSLKSVVENIDFPHHFLKSMYLGNKETAAIQNVLTPILRYKPKIVVTEFSLAYISLWLLIFFKFIFNYKLIYWTHGFTEDGQKTFSTKDKIVQYLYKFADAIICYSDKRKEMLQQNIKNCPPVFVAYNTIETKRLLELFDGLNRKGKDRVRQELGWKHEFNLVYIGRLIPEKRIDLLLETFQELCKVEKNIALHIIGTGEEEEKIKQYNNLPIYYYGEVWNEDISANILFGADYCLNPGYIGLSVVHNFCFGTPVITCHTTSLGPYHSPEIDYIEDRVNGIFCEDNPVELARDIVQLLNKEVIERLSANAHETAVTKCSQDKMLDGFIDAFEYCNAK